MTYVPYIVHESAVDRLERIIKRLWIMTLVIFVAFVVSNCVWIWYDSQFEEVVTTQEITQEANAEGGSAEINDGVKIVNGNSKTDNQDND